MKKILLACVVVLCLFELAVAPPVDTKKKEEKDEKRSLADVALDYGRYLQEVVQILEEDKDFAKKLENVSADRIKSGDVAHELDFVKHSVRNKLDELKRMELDRLRELARKEMEQNELGVYRNEDGRLSPPPGDGRQWRSLPIGDGLNRNNVKMPYHLDVNNPHTFEVEDLKKLILSASKDLDELNQQRKEEFKRYEMEKEHQYREGLKHMTEDERKTAESQHQEQIKKHKDHPAVHHPGSKQQLEQVWEDVDQLPKDEFDPKTFFRMHDINGDGYLDEEEVKALVALEVRKMYNVNNTEDDPVEMQEEFNRMEEHIFKEADKNHDRLISLPEFIDLTKRPDFEQDEGWKGLDEQQVYTPEELMEYERQLAAQAGYGGYPVEGGYPNQGYPNQGYPNQGGHPNQGYPNQGGHPNQGYANQGGHPNQGYPPNQGGHPNQGYPPNQGGHPNQGYANQGGHPNQGGYPQGGHPNQGYPPNQGGHPPPGGYPPQGYHPDQQYGFQPPPNNQQGIQFQQLPPHQQQGQGSHPQQGQQHPNIPPQQQQQHGVPQGQPPQGGGPPHYPTQYAPTGAGGPQNPPQAAGQPQQPPSGTAPPQHQGVPVSSSPPQQPAAPIVSAAPSQPQAVPASNQQQQQPAVPVGQGSQPK